MTPALVFAMCRVSLILLYDFCLSKTANHKKNYVKKKLQQQSIAHGQTQQWLERSALRKSYLKARNVKYSIMLWILLDGIGDFADLAIDSSKRPKNWTRDVWYIGFTIDISTMRKYTIDPRMATGRNSSLAALILTSVSAATANFSLTSKAVSLVVANISIKDSSSTSEP